MPWKYLVKMASSLVTTIVAIGVIGTKLNITTVTTSSTTVVVIGVPQLSRIPLVVPLGRLSII